MTGPRVVRAANAGSFTLDGTRTFVVGRSRVAIIDPGPAEAAHLDRLASEVAEAESGTIVLTHGHPDHAEGTRDLARLTGFPTAGPLEGVDRRIRDGDRIEVDDGALWAIATPGHAREHLAFHHRPEHAGTPPGDVPNLLETEFLGGDLYVGDLVLGEGSTTWVGGYAGCVRDYLDSLDRVERLAPDRLLPAHGPILENPAEVIARFRAHRVHRIDQVRSALQELPDSVGFETGPPSNALLDEIILRVYGRRLTGRAADGARWSVRAILEYLGVAPFPTAEAPGKGSDRLAPGSGAVVSSE